MARKNFATPVDESLQDAFKAECKKQGYKMNEVIEILMNGFVNGDIQIEKEISYKIHQGSKKEVESCHDSQSETASTIIAKRCKCWINPAHA